MLLIEGKATKKSSMKIIGKMIPEKEERLALLIQMKKVR